MVEQIARYEVKRELERGGMATVYLAFDPRFRRQVAIKVLPRQFTHDPRYLSRFEQEARIIATVEHPAIVPVHDFGEYNDAPYLVMRFMAGGNLRLRLSNGPLTLGEISSSLNRLAPALDHAHQFGIIHRDLKPSNILFDYEGRPYLADFGIARMAEASHTMTIIGTPAYMSPEQAESKEKLDGRSDIYAMGVILFELLTGKQPYVAETPTGQMVMHILEPVPDILAANPDLPPGTQKVIEKAMAKDREERYQNALELATAFRELVAIPTVAAAEMHTRGAEPDSETAGFVSQEGLATAAGAAAVPAQKEGDQVVPGLTADSAERAADSDVWTQPEAAGSTWRDLPGWVWWVGTLALLVVVALGIRAVLSGGADNDGAAARAPVQEEEVVPVIESSTPEENDMTAGADLPPHNAELGDSWIRPSDSMTMVYVPAGTFPMGSEEGDDDETPVHEVSLDAFWIDRMEVTNQQFAEFGAETGYETTAEKQGSSYAYKIGVWTNTAGADWQHPDGPASNLEGQEDHPVTHMSWEDADAYCSWAGGQLPTEAQWEHAARGPQGLSYPWGNRFDGTKANFCDANCPTDYADEAFDDGYVLRSPVDSFPIGASWTGALNMAGNMAEWVKDRYDQNYYGISPRNNPQGPLHGEFVILRGGDWTDPRDNLRSSNRINLHPDSGGVTFGIRCVVAPSAADEETTGEDVIETKSAEGEATAEAEMPLIDASLGDTWIRPADDMTMVYVPAGAFPMGSEDGEDNEAPVHEVSLDAFWIDRTEVTNEQFAEFVASTGFETTAERIESSHVLIDGGFEFTAAADWQHPRGAESDLNDLQAHPVVHASWKDAQTYCVWAGAKLPTEAQWEYAARGPEGKIYPWGDIFDGAKVNSCDVNCPSGGNVNVNDGYILTAPVGSYPTNASWAGALDMAGNVIEWVNDWYDENYYTQAPAHNPQGPESGDDKLLRGGGWVSGGEYGVRSAQRDDVGPLNTFSDFGFRCIVVPGS